MTENSGEYKTQVRTYGAGASYVTNPAAPGVWLIEPEEATLAAVCDAVVAFSRDYPDVRITQVRIILTFDGNYIGVVDAVAN